MGVAQTEIESLSSDRMKGLCGVAEQHATLSHDAARVFQSQRKAAPVDDAREAGGNSAAGSAGADMTVERAQEFRIGQSEEGLGPLRRRRPYQSVAVAFGQQRDRTLGREALEGDASVRLAKIELPGHGDLVVVVTASRTVGKKLAAAVRERKSTRLNSSHSSISYAVFCLKKKTEDFNR